MRDAARLSAGGAWPLRVLAGQHPLGQRRPDDLADPLAGAQRQHLGLDAPAQDRVLGLVGHQPVQPQVVGQGEGVADLAGGPLAHPDVVDLALADQVVQGPQGLLQRGLVVEAVALVQVEVVGAQPAQAGVAGLHDVLAGQAAVVGAVPDREVDLGGEHVGGAGVPLEGLAEDLLGRPPAVHVGGVEEVHPELVGAGHARPGLVGLDPDPVGQPGAEPDLRHPDPAGPQPPVLHLCPRLLQLVSCSRPPDQLAATRGRPARRGAPTGPGRTGSGWSAAGRRWPSRRCPAHGRRGYAAPAPRAPGASGSSARRSRPGPRRPGRSRSAGPGRRRSRPTTARSVMPRRAAAPAWASARDRWARRVGQRLGQARRRTRPPAPSGRPARAAPSAAPAPGTGPTGSRRPSPGSCGTAAGPRAAGCGGCASGRARAPGCG